jgi:hypothetical protein
MALQPCSHLPPPPTKELNTRELSSALLSKVVKATGLVQGNRMENTDKEIPVAKSKMTLTLSLNLSDSSPTIDVATNIKESATPIKEKMYPRTSFLSRHQRVRGSAYVIPNIETNVNLDMHF